MPFRNGTGPGGLGPKTGKGAGNCPPGRSEVGRAVGGRRTGSGRGLGAGRGRGMGSGPRDGRGGGRGGGGQR